MKWVNERVISIVPYGIHLSEKLVKLAKERLPVYKDNLFMGNAWDGESPRKFKYVRTELVYVPEHLQKTYIQRIMNHYLDDSGRLLVAGYTSRKFPDIKPDVDKILEKQGFTVEKIASGFWNDYEETRIAVVSK